MDSFKLDHFLRTYSRTEIKHKNGFATQYATKGKYRLINNIYQFNTDNVPDSDTIIVYKNQRFDDVPTHVHDHIEINYMYSGSCSQIIDGHEVILKKGQMTLIDTRTPHAIGYTDENDILINFIIKKDYLNNSFFSKLTDNNLITSFFINAINQDNTVLNYLIFNTENNQRLQMFILEFIYEYFYPTLNSTEIKKSLFVLIILEMINTLDTSINLESITKSSTIIILALQYLEKNFLTCSLDSTAKYLNINPCYLTTLLKKNFNYSYKELIIKLKMQYASKLLLNSSYSIDQIAHECGYQNLSFFYKKFKETYYCLPKEYRNRNKKR